jgi:DNA-binding CsgD family transcriptional regulator
MQPLTPPASILTPRQEEIYKLLATGSTIKQIARVLGISPRTVDMHIRRVRNRLCASTRDEAMARVVSAGWVQLGD